MGSSGSMALQITKERTLLSASPVAELLVRRAALFFAMMLSGGNLILPRALLLVAMVACILLVSNPAKIFRRELANIWALLGTIMVIALIGMESLELSGFVVRYASFFGALLLLTVYLDLPRSSLVRDAMPLFIFFAIQAIITPVFVLFFPNLITSFTVGEATQFTFAFILFYHETIEGAGFMGLVRPNGFFFEPGVLQIYLNIFLYAALFQYKRPILIGMAVLAVAATQSTTGLAISCALIGWSGFKYLRTLDASTTFLAMILLPISILPIVWFTYRNVVEKLFGNMASSAAAREFDLYTGLRIVSEYPLFGIGFSQERFRTEFYTFGRKVETMLGNDVLERSLSNGLLHLAVVLGIPMMLLFVFAILRQRFLGEAVVGGAIVVVSLLTEALVLTPFFTMIAFSGLLITSPYARSRHGPYIAPRRKTAIAR